MKKILLTLIVLISASAHSAESKKEGASQSLKTSFEPVRSTDLSTVISTNIADLTKSRGNIVIDVLMTRQAAATLSYSSISEEEVREKVLNRPRLTVDRTQFGVGANFFLKPLTSEFNFSVSPSLIFQTERDAVNTDSTSGFGVRAMGIFKPLPRLMAQGGIAATSIGSETSADALVGLGLLF